MEKEGIDRINELSRIARERELSAAEQAERAELRRRYIDDFRKATVSVLDNTYIQTPDGKKHPLPKRKNPETH